jgi:hypothetical protein
MTAPRCPSDLADVDVEANCNGLRLLKEGAFRRAGGTSKHPIRLRGQQENVSLACHLVAAKPTRTITYLRIASGVVCDLTGLNLSASSRSQWYCQVRSHLRA